MTKEEQLEEIQNTLGRWQKEKEMLQNQAKVLNRQMSMVSKEMKKLRRLEREIKEQG